MTTMTCSDLDRAAAKEELDAAKARLAARAQADYLNWNAKSPDFAVSQQYRLEFETGQNYCRIVKTDVSGSRSCFGFIVIKPTKGFKYGDLLKSAGWKAPATNFSRGNIFNEADIKRVVWTGIY
jgi:hypothetical protein